MCVFVCACVRACMRVCRVVLPERPWYVRAAKTLASLSALYRLRIRTSGLVYIPQTGNDKIMDLMNGGFI